LVSLEQVIEPDLAHFLRHHRRKILYLADRASLPLKLLEDIGLPGGNRLALLDDDATRSMRTFANTRFDRRQVNFTVPIKPRNKNRVIRM
jgi:hypothetical protein